MSRQPPVCSVGHNCSHCVTRTTAAPSRPGGILARDDPVFGQFSLRLRPSRKSDARKKSDIAASSPLSARTCRLLRFACRLPTVRRGEAGSGVLVAASATLSAVQWRQRPAVTARPGTVDGSAHRPARPPSAAPTTTTSTPEFSFDDSVPPPETRQHRHQLRRHPEVARELRKLARCPPSGSRARTPTSSPTARSLFDALRPRPRRILRDNQQRVVERLGGADDVHDRQHDAATRSPRRVVEDITLHRRASTRAVVS